MGQDQSSLVGPGRYVSLTVDGGSTTCTDSNPTTQDARLVRPKVIGSIYWLGKDNHTLVPWNGTCSERQASRLPPPSLPVGAPRAPVLSTGPKSR